MRRWIAAGIIVAVLASSGVAEAKKKPKNKKKKAPVTAIAKNPPTITAAEFTRLETGMTYDQAVEVIGGPGEVLSQVDIAGTKTIMYMWKGTGIANANAMFQNGVLISKAQFGLT